VGELAILCARNRNFFLRVTLPFEVMIMLG
jgi:hypothetical protein